MDDDEGHRWGAAEGTGLGLLAAGAVLGMAWLGELFGSVAVIGIGRFALLFSAMGAGVLAWAMRSPRTPSP